mmetsp:Transcript_19934/g.36303  ORF Transcript_19934/g.36303 Transcript_19934/m.36303 type:complete len:167 (-) Transcript_19934:169-669(-)
MFSRHDAVIPNQTARLALLFQPRPTPASRTPHIAARVDARVTSTSLLAWRFGHIILCKSAVGQHDSSCIIPLCSITTTSAVVVGKVQELQGTKHIRMKYFFITDRIQHGNVTVEHMPSERMWIDVNNKPKQGRPSRVDRSEMMGCPIDLPSSLKSSPGYRWRRYCK